MKRFLLLALFPLIAHAAPAPNLVLAGPESCAGKSVCNERVYETPKDSLYLAVKGTVNTWKPYAQVLNTDQVLICKIAQEPGTYSNCTQAGAPMTAWVRKDSLTWATQGPVKLRTLSWEPPTLDTDGAPLRELLSYRFYGETGDPVNTSLTHQDIYAYGCYQVTAIASGGESAKSTPPTCVKPPVPRAPESVTVQ